MKLVSSGLNKKFLCLNLYLQLVFGGQAAIDMVFVMDGSGSIDDADFLVQKQGIAAALEDRILVPRDGSVGFGLVQFSSNAVVEIPITVINSESVANLLISQVRGLIQMGGSTNPGSGVNLASSMLKNSSRPNVVKHICLSTDGIPNEPGTNSEALVFFNQSIENAKAGPDPVHAYGTIGIREPMEFELEHLNSIYAPAAFGGGGATMVRNSIEFANAFGPICFGKSVRLLGMEVIQSIQDLNNSVRLIEEKLTFVRIHMEPEDSNVLETPVSIVLRGFDLAGNELSNGPLVALNAPDFKAKQGAMENRGDWDSSLNFRLPKIWTKGVVRLVLESQGSRVDCSSAPGLTGDCEKEVVFTPGGQLELKFFGIQVNDEDGNETKAPPLEELPARLYSIFPLSNDDLNVETGETKIAIKKDANGVIQVTQEDLLKKLERMRVLDLCFPVLGCDRVYFGLVDKKLAPTTVTSSGMVGTLLGSAYCGNGSKRIGWSIFEPKLRLGYNTFAHEIGHSLGLDHPPDRLGCGSESGGCFLSPLNYSDINSQAALGPQGALDELIFGLNSIQLSTEDPSGVHHIDPKIYDSAEIRALMSYCSTGEVQWIADVEYEAVYNQIVDTFGLMRLDGSAKPNSIQLHNAPQNYTLVSGSVNSLSNEVIFEPLITLEFEVAPPDPLPGVYTLQGIDDNGMVLKEIAFSPEFPAGPSPAVFGNFMIAFPAHQTVKTYSILLNGSEIGRLSGSDNVPVVNVLFPNGGETVSGDSVELKWAGTDSDGDDLTYSVQYSKDSGMTWETLVVDWPETTYTANFDFLDGSDKALIRVIASDGFNSSIDESDAFFVSGKAPKVKILSPKKGEEYFGVQSVYFSGEATDVEDGALPDSAYQWSSNLNGDLGTGSEIVINASQLSEGDHQVTLTVFDSDGNISIDSVQFSIFRVAGGNRIQVTVLAPIRMNPQTGLYEHQVELLNRTFDEVDGIKMSVTGLITVDHEIELHNKNGLTDQGIPFVTIPGPILPNQSIELTLEYYSPSRVEPGPIYEVEPATFETEFYHSGERLEITKVLYLPDEGILIEFQTVPGKSYFVEYSDDLHVWISAHPPVKANANRTQWIDRGPPKTMVRPQTSGQRHYRIFELSDEPAESMTP